MMTQEVLEQAYGKYLGAYSVTDANDRERLLNECVSTDITCVLPGEESLGIAQLSQHIERFQKARPGAHFRSRVLSVHHEQFMAELKLHDNERVLSSAQVYGRFDERGLFTYLIAFFPHQG